jgi:Cu(I)/Ag(I) efflux system protein CusF
MNPNMPGMAAMPGMQQGIKAAETHGVGIIRAIDTARSTITLQDQAITSLGWPAMTMTFKVASPEVLKGVMVGEKVQFTLHPTGMAGTVTAITPAHS